MMAGGVGEGECARAAASPPSLSLFPAHPRPACRPGTRPVARPQRRPAPHPAGRGCGAGARRAGRARGARPRRRLGQNAAAAMQPTRRRRRPCDTTTGRFAVGGGPRRRRLPASQAVGCGRWDAARRTASGGRFSSSPLRTLTQLALHLFFFTCPSSGVTLFSPALRPMHALAARASCRLVTASSSTTSSTAAAWSRVRPSCAPARFRLRTKTETTRPMASAGPGDAPPAQAQQPSPFTGPGSDELRALCVGPCSR